MSFNKYPYTDFHEANLDFLLNKVGYIDDVKDTVDRLATEAEASKNAAKASEDNAKASEDAAKTSEENAQTSAESASASAGAAADIVADTNNQIAVLQSRVDNIIPDGTQTEGNTELLDIRVGADGTTYDSAGNAVRKQISTLKGDLAEIVESGKNKYNVAHVTDGGGLRADGTFPSANTNLSYSEYIPVKANEPVTISNTLGSSMRYALYGANKAVVFGAVDIPKAQINEGYTVTPTVDGFIIVSGQTSEKRSVQIEYGSSRTEFEPYQVYLAEKIRLEKNNDYKSLATKHYARITNGILPTPYNGAIGTISADVNADKGKDYYVNNIAHPKYGTMMYWNGTEWVYDEENKAPGVLAIGNTELTNAAKLLASYNSNRKCVQFAVITDTHSNEFSSDINTKLFKNFLNIKCVDFGIHCGDIISSYGLTRNQYIGVLTENIIQYNGIESPMYFAKGNHDSNINSTSTQQDIDTNALSKYQYYSLIHNRCGSRVIDNNNPYGGYYYFDFLSEKIRIIVLNDFEQPKLHDAVYHSEYQTNWLYNTALRFEDDGWSVVVISHYITSRTVSTGVILEAFCHPGTTYTDSDSGVSYTFPLEHSGQLVAHIHGHLHTDAYNNSTGWNRIGVQRGYAENSEIGTLQEFCFSIFTIDIVGNKIYETRIGRGNSREYSINPPSQTN